MTTWKCPDCGTVMVETFGQYKCTNPLCKSNQPTRWVWFCPVCHHWNDENLRFCEDCGRDKPANPRFANK